MGRARGYIRNLCNLPLNCVINLKVLFKKAKFKKKEKEIEKETKKEKASYEKRTNNH